jgi:hypothetical protein
MLATSKQKTGFVTKSYFYGISEPVLGALMTVLLKLNLIVRGAKVIGTGHQIRRFKQESRRRACSG